MFETKAEMNGAAQGPSQHAQSQYTNTSARLAARLAIHNWNTYPQNWFSWARDRIPQSGLDVLEVGAGTGQLWLEPSSAAASSASPSPSSTESTSKSSEDDKDRSTDKPKSLTLTDFSPAMCAELEKVRIPGVPISVQQAGAEHLPFDDSSFDVVVANHMLYHVDSPDAALCEFRRVLRPNGTLVVALNGMDHLDELLGLGERVGRPSTIRNRARITAENARGQIEKYFADVSEERFPGAFEVGSVKPVVEYLGSLDERPLGEEQVGIVREVVGEAIERDGVFRVKKNMVLFKGGKGV
jgi:SAM-dependent methyltransferase